MRLLKLVVCGVAFVTLAFAPAALAIDDPAASTDATAPAEADDPTAAAAVGEGEAVAATTDDAEAMAADSEAVDAVAAAVPAGDPDAVVPAAVADVQSSETLDDATVAEMQAPASPAPSEGASESLPSTEPVEAETPAAGPVLGAIGYDSQGRQGRIHIVIPGDTLWDISDAYLGTPWVWPSIWTDNRNIENPHVIHPGDHIWITDSEMRVVSPAEAEALLAARPAAPEEFPAAEPAPMAPPLEVAVVPDAPLTRRVSVREWVGLISEEKLEAAASIVKRIPSHVMLAQTDRVYIGMGEGDVQVGDEFEIIRDDEKVFDPESGRFLGYHVEALGWLEVVEVHEETSLAKIRLSMLDVGVGDKLIPRRPESLDISIRQSPEDVEGEIAFFPRSRVVIGPLDFVYLNRGTLDGLETGSPLEVIRGGDLVDEPLHGEKVRVPDRVVAQLLVVDAQPETAVALVAHADTDLRVGDNFRGATE